jgi:alkylhydroperoxidase family enzyme
MTVTTESLFTTKPTAEQTEARMDDILGHGLRIPAMHESEISEDMREVVAPPKGYGTPGDTPEVFRVMLRNPELLKVYHPMGGYFIVEGKMSPRDRELVILRVGWLSQAPYEWGEHVGIARNVGLSGEEIERVTDGPEASGWNEHDRALLRAVDELVSTAMISDETWAVLARTLDAAQMIELPVVVGTYQATAYLQNSLRLTLRPSNPGLSAR